MPKSIVTRGLKMKLTKTENEILKQCMVFTNYTCWFSGSRYANAALKLVEKGLAKEVSRDFGNNWSIQIKSFAVPNDKEDIK